MLTALRRVRWMGRVEPRRESPIYICCYHKVGTKLLRKVFKNISKDFGWKFAAVSGLCTSVPSGCDVILFPHSLVDLDAIKHPFTTIHVIRDPRDVVVSGYLYHMRCREPWCTNTNIDFSHPIRYPVVPRSQEHRPEDWKNEYLRSLNGRSYQSNLQAMSQEEGILFEMDHYGSWTIAEMEAWNYSRPNTLELKFEDLMRSFERSFVSMFEHLGFSEEQTRAATAIAVVEDINKMTDKEIMMNNHISSRSTSKWSRYFTEDLKQAFKSRFPDTLQRLGYESSDDW